jgi:hypothetical protein
VSRIKTIVLPKIEETIKVLQELAKDLLGQQMAGEQKPAQEPETEIQKDKEAV